MRGIGKKFGHVPALIDASLEVLPGEVMALVGQNGAGKSTMIKVLNGFVARDAGDITYSGRPWAATSPQMAQRGGISTIFQEINLIPLRSVTENIYLGRELRNRAGLLAWGRMDEGARALLKEFDVAVDVRQPLNRFSTAVQQMVAIARAVSFEAKLVIMDEATSSLDEHEVQVLFQTIRRLKSQGVSVVFVSHKLDELYQVCDRVTVMRDGCTVAVAAMADMTKLQLVATMLGRDLAEVRRKGATAFSGEAHEVGDEILRANRAQGRTPGQRRGPVDPQGRDRRARRPARLGPDRDRAGHLRGRSASNGARSSTWAASPGFREPVDAIEAGIGFCSEDRKHEGIIPGMSVRENLTLALLPALSRSGMVDEPRQRSIVERFIKEIGIKCASPEQPIRELSGGNQQKVLLARWLCMNPEAADLR